MKELTAKYDQAKNGPYPTSQPRKRRYGLLLRRRNTQATGRKRHPEGASAASQQQAKTR